MKIQPGGPDPPLTDAILFWNLLPGETRGPRQALGAISQGNTMESAEPNQKATVMPNYLTGVIY